jgi:multidrug transporter EmrE-like cation transporter
MWHYIALAFAIVASACGQILLKTGSDSSSFIDQLFRPATILGLACYGFSAGGFIFAIRNIPLAVAGPTSALTYVAGVLAGVFLFKEVLATTQIAGIVLVIIGVVLLNNG